MTQIVNLRAYTRPANAPTLVLMDLQQEQLTSSMVPATVLDHVLTNCEAAMQRARANKLPVAFARLIPRSQMTNPATPQLRWIDRFAPTRSDMIFDRDRPSCYASPEFSDVIDHGSRYFVLAGLTGEASCLSTAIDAFHRGHKVTFLSDASASRAVSTLDSADTHRAVTELIALYASVMTTTEWIAECDRATPLSVRR
jgi:nicotinamidase-related amidase